MEKQKYTRGEIKLAAVAFWVVVGVIAVVTNSLWLALAGLVIFSVIVLWANFWPRS